MMASLWFLLLALPLTDHLILGEEASPSPSNKTHVTLGLLVPMGWGRDFAGAVVPALEYVRRHQLLPAYDVDWMVRNSGCTPYKGLRDAIEVWQSEEDLVAFIGHACSIVCQPVALVAAAWNLPTVSYSCTSYPLSDKTQYPTFFRSVGHEAMSAPIYVATIQAFGWDRCVIVTTPEDLWTFGAIETKKLMEAAGIRTFYHVINPIYNGNEVNADALAAQIEIVETFKDKARFIVTFMYSDELRMMMLTAYDAGMLDGGYIFYGTEMIDVLNDVPSYRPNISNPELFEGFFSLFPEDFSGPAWRQLQEEAAEAMMTHPLFAEYQVWPDFGPDDISSYAGNFYDCVLLWAYGANRTLEAGGSIYDGMAVTRNIFDFSFRGATGTVAMNAYGDREKDQTISIIMPNSTVVELFKWYAANHTLVKTYKPESLDDWTGIIWSGRSETVPTGIPSCGWTGDLCLIPPADYTLPASLGGASCLLSIGLILAIVFHTYKRRLQRLEEEEINKYLIDIASINNCVGAQSATDLSASAGVLDDDRKSTINVPLPLVIDSSAYGHDTVASYDGDLVTVTSYPLKNTGAKDPQLRNEIKQIKGLSYENLAAFVGVCKTPVMVLILSEHAAKGSLEDLIADSEIQLTLDFKISFLSDISRGMRFLHKSILGHHGSLSSRSCIVDKRWTCKVAHFGFASIRGPRSTQQLRGHPEQVGVGPDSNLLWMAPELLRGEVSGGSRPADVYAFGIIVQEVGTRSAPYDDNTPALNLAEIVDAVKRASEPPHRPYIDPESCSEQWRQLAEICWDEDPSKRPSFTDIQKTIIRINNGKTPRLVDTIIRNLEKHTSTLEDIVSERVLELTEERARMDALLSELLPPSVANQLKSNQTVEPETFESVTIFFSDIVGFTRVSAQSTPFQVVVMLNKLYSVFDQILSQHDVYKVATIGDAYMVASGVPVTNGNRHADEISAMSLEMLDAIQNFPIPHIPGEQLYMRIGLHTGSCVAGLTGSKAPRYLLFGESVDIASRIEAGGEAMKVHLSYSTAALLMNGERFDVALRGEMPIKGIGAIKTYWLLGQKDMPPNDVMDAILGVTGT